MFGSLSNFARRAIYFNLSIATVGALELFGYYYLGPKIIRSDFESTPLPEKANYSEPVLVVYDTNKFIFNHRGGKKAAESLIKDTFDNNKLIKRAVFAQLLTSISISIGFAKERMFMSKVAFIGLATNISLLYWSLYGGLSLMVLSRMVAQGREVVWENLNEARFAQRVEEIGNYNLEMVRRFGMFGTLGVITYCTPVFGIFICIIGKALSAHERLQ